MKGFRNIAICSLCLCGHLFALGQNDSSTQNNDSLDMQVDKIKLEITALQELMQRTLAMRSLPDSSVHECPEELKLRHTFTNQICDEIELWHSLMRFSVEDFLGERSALDALQNWLNKNEALVDELDLVLDEETKKKKETLKAGLKTFVNVKSALSSEEPYVIGLSPDLKDALSNLPPSMKFAGRTARAMLTMAPSYRELACTQMNSLEDEPLESLMAFWIYDGQFKEKNKFKSQSTIDEKGSRYIDWLEPSTVRSMLSEYPEFYLNEERLRLYTWLNDQVIEIMFDEEDSSKLCD